MEQNKKWIFLCLTVFFVLVCTLVVKGWQKTYKDIPQTAKEEILVAPTATGGTVSVVNVVEDEREESKGSKKSSERKTKTKEVDVKRERGSSTPKNQEQSKSQKKVKTVKKKKLSVTSTPKPQITPQPTKEPAVKTNTIEFSILCTEILNHKDLWKDGIEEIVPKDGIFYSGTVKFSNGESAYDVLKRICKENKIVLDSVFTPLYGTYYVKGIGNLYEFDCGSESGWKYSVNGELQGIGSSDYIVKSGDKIIFYYECIFSGGE